MATAATSAVSAGTSAVLAVAAGWVRWQIYNNGSVVAFYGYGSDVTTATGTPIAPGEAAWDQRAWANGEAPAIYVLTTSGSSDCRVLAIYA